MFVLFLLIFVYNKKLLLEKYNKSWFINCFITLLDLVFMSMVLYFFITQLLGGIILILNKININLEDIVSFMSNNQSSITQNSTSTNTQIIHDDGSWSNAIRSLFIYGSGGYRLYLNRAAVTPGSRFAIIGSTLIADSVSRLITNAINDPDYLKNHLSNWSFRNDGEGTGSVTVNSGSSVDNAINEISKSNKLINTDNGLDELSNKLFNSLMDYVKPILEPVQVSYSNDVLADQIYGLGILLFILSLLTIILMIFFILNVIVFIYSDKLMNYFSNKFIKWYININKKLIGIELFFLSGSILYFMYILSYGIHFIATHPIIIT